MKSTTLTAVIATCRHALAAADSAFAARINGSLIAEGTAPAPKGAPHSTDVGGDANLVPGYTDNGTAWVKTVSKVAQVVRA